MTTIKTIILCLILSLPFTNQAISAGGILHTRTKYINDFANVITPTDAKLIRDALKQVYIDADVEGTVSQSIQSPTIKPLTIPSKNSPLIFSIIGEWATRPMMMDL